MKMACYDEKGQRCKNKADHLVHAGDPHARWVTAACQRHAQGAIDEYYEKLGELWMATPIDVYGIETAGPTLYPRGKK